MNLIDLIKIDDLSDRDRQIRRAFTPYTSPLEVEGRESLALAILLNLTTKRNEIKDLCDVKTARDILMDEPFLERCIRTVQWLHTHNLKYPNARVSHQRAIFPAVDTIPGCATSADEPYILGWSHNSSEVNYAKLFCSFFAWEGKATNLAFLLKNNEQVWVDCFLNLGLSENKVKKLIVKLSSYLPNLSAPLDVSPYSKQVRIPYQQSYCSVTPVVSHSFQSKIQTLALSNQFSSEIVNHTHPASIGDLTASLGGKVRVLSSLPLVNCLTEGHVFKVNKFSLNNSEIMTNYFLQALNILTFSPSFTSEKERINSRGSALKIVKKTFLSWLAPLLELKFRSSLLANKSELLLILELLAVR